MIKVLIADDQSAWINFNKRAVHEILGDNIEIHTASTAQEGYNLLLENMLQPYDYILTDMQMEDEYYPKMAGEWLIEQAKTLAQYQNTKIIIISASNGIKQIADGLGVYCIPKSVAAATLESYKEILLH